MQLTVRDLKISDNGKVQNHIVPLQPLDDLPIRAGFLFDVSASVLKDIDFDRSVIETIISNPNFKAPQICSLRSLTGSVSRSMILRLAERSLCSVKGCYVTVELEAESEATVRTELLRFNGALERDPAIDVWMKQHQGELGAIAHQWFEVMRKCGDEVRELFHDGCPVACLGDAPFAYVNIFTSHVNVGFFQGAGLPDPASLLQGTGRFMRHVKLKPGPVSNAAALNQLIDAAYLDIKSRVENG